MSFDGPVLRVATEADLDAMAAVMRASVLELFPRFYDERQVASAAVYVAHVDPTLVADGTYFVHDVGGEIVGCGGWSRRGRLYTGSGATNLPHVDEQFGAGSRSPRHPVTRGWEGRAPTLGHPSPASTSSETLVCGAASWWPAASRQAAADRVLVLRLGMDVDT
jgi:hypothetical protein